MIRNVNTLQIEKSSQFLTQGHPAFAGISEKQDQNITTQRIKTILQIS